MASLKVEPTLIDDDQYENHEQQKEGYMRKDVEHRVLTMNSNVNSEVAPQVQMINVQEINLQTEANEQPENNLLSQENSNN